MREGEKERRGREDVERERERKEVRRKKGATQRFCCVDASSSSTFFFHLLSRKALAFSLSFSFSLFEHVREAPLPARLLRNSCREAESNSQGLSQTARPSSQTSETFEKSLMATTLPASSSSHCCRSCASLASTSAATTPWVAQGRRRRPQALSGRALGPAELRREQASNRGADVAGSSSSSSVNRRKNLAVAFGLGAAASRRTTTTVAAAAAPQNADLPPAPVRSQQTY